MINAEIKLLTPDRLDEACELAESVFKESEGRPEKCLRCIFDPFKNTFDLKNCKIFDRRCWFVENSEKKLVGIIGLYREFEDYKEAVWVGWFCVDPDFRGQKIGSRLLEFVIEKAKKSGSRFLRTFTSDEENEAKAQILYESRGLKIIKKTPHEDWNELIRELEINPPQNAS